MFCYKCGSEINDVAEFCHKCGVKLSLDPAHQSLDAPVSAPPPQSTEGIGFKEFVDNYVQKTTKFKSADDLLKKGNPLMFIWVCVGVSALAGIGAGPMGIVVLGAFIGYVSAYFTGVVLRIKLNRRMYSIRPRPTGDVDLDELVKFLSSNLQYLSPCFKNWERSNEAQAIRCTVQSEKVNTVIQFGINHENKRFYEVSARKAKVWDYVVISGLGISASKANAGFGEYRCLYMAAPILTAAVEYYLKLRGLYSQ